MKQSDAGPPAPRPDKDYAEIEAAVMESARGRWFLAEFARRNRSADTSLLLDAIHRLQIAVQDRNPPDGLNQLRRDIMEMATSIAQTRHELAAMSVAMNDEAEMAGAHGELNSIVATTEKATSDILGAAEQIQEIAWTLREQGVAAEPCDALDAHATDIYTACSFQDLTGQRIGKVVGVLSAIEKRLNALINLWALDDIEVKSRDDVVDDTPEAEWEEAPSASQREVSPFEFRQTSQQDIDDLLDEMRSPARQPTEPDLAMADTRMETQQGDDASAAAGQEPLETADVAARAGIEPAYEIVSIDELVPELDVDAPLELEDISWKEPVEPVEPAPSVPSEAPQTLQDMGVPSEHAPPEGPPAADDPLAPDEQTAPAEAAERDEDIFDRLASDLRAAMRLSTPAATPGPDRAEENEPAALRETIPGPEGWAPPSPEQAPSPDPQRDENRLVGLSYAHKMALFS